MASKMNAILTIFTIFTFFSTSLFASSDGINCRDNYNQILRGTDIEIQSSQVKVDLDNPLHYDVNEFEQWVFQVKGKMVKSMLDKEGHFSKHLNTKGDMDINERKALAYSVEIRPLDRDSKIYVALFWSDDNLNRSQMRTELFEYGGGDAKPGEIPSERTLFLHESCEACRGLNLTGKSFMKFRAEAQKINAPLYPEEKAFFDHAIAELEKRHPEGDYNVISLFAKGAAIDTLVHEGHHALYDTDPVYKKALTDYWDSHIRGKQDEEIKTSFRIPYSSYEIMQDEFYAYLLQPTVFGQANPMDKFKEKHLDAVVETLKKAGVLPPFY